MSNNYPKGSEWHKWDFHVHTPASALQHSLGDDWDTFVDKLIGAAETREVAAVVTADYFTIEGYRQLLRYMDRANQTIAHGEKTLPLLVVPGVELRLNIFNADNESINLHIMFDPDACSCDFIEQSFLEELKVGYRSAEYSLKQQNLLAIGKSIAEGTEVNPGDNFSGLGEPQKRRYIRSALRAVTLAKRDINEALQDIDEIFERQNISSKKYLIGIVGKGHGGIDSLKWFEDNKDSSVFSRAGLIREDLTRTADLIFSNNSDDRNFYLGKRVDTEPEEVENRFKRLKPCVWGSDSHSLDNLLHPSNGNTDDYTWIKANVCFEGLRQIIFEPELRVKVQADNPSETETYARLDKVTISLPNDLLIKDNESGETIPFCLRGEHKVEFSNNLTCIVGGRGSGKSTLVHVLYNSWQSTDSSRLHDVNSPLMGLQFGANDPLKEVRKCVNAGIPSSTEFFLQNEIEKFARDKYQMSRLVRLRLERLSTIDGGEYSLSGLEFRWKEKAQAYDVLMESYDESRELEGQINEILGEIETLKKQTEVITSEKYKTLQQDIETLAGEISRFSEHKKEFDQTTKQLDDFVIVLKKLDWSMYKGQDVITHLVADLENRKTELVAAYTESVAVYNGKDYSGQLTSKRNELQAYLKERGLSDENVGELSDANVRIAEMESLIKEIGNKKTNPDAVYSRKDIVVTEYKTAFTKYQDRFITVSEELQKRLKGLKFDIDEAEITFHAQIDENRLKSDTIDFIKQLSTSKTTLNSEHIDSVLFQGGVSVNEMVENKDKIRDVISKSERAEMHTQILKELISSDVNLEKISLKMCRTFYGIDSLQVQTKLGNKLLQNTSFGERCGIVVAIVLVAGTNPILIDQPEDNLDGRFISKVLVPLIRNQKLNRQVVLVTRDANMVITGDSELITILDMGTIGQTTVTPATIESREHREDYIWVLDGGERAFQSREEKYSISD